MAGYSPSEIMVVRAARELKDGEGVFVGIGVPNLACNLARRLGAPGLVLIYESGGVRAAPPPPPRPLAGPRPVTALELLRGPDDHDLRR